MTAADITATSSLSFITLSPVAVFTISTIPAAGAGILMVGVSSSSSAAAVFTASWAFFAFSAFFFSLVSLSKELEHT